MRLILFFPFLTGGVLGALEITSCGGSTTTVDGGPDAMPDTFTPDVSQKDVAADAPVDAPPDSGPVTGRPPPPPDGGVPTANVYTFAIKTVYLGEAARGGGTPSATAWKSFGYNVDGLDTTSASTDVCTLFTGAPKANQNDGNSGIDNAWGAVILPIIQTAAGLTTPSLTETTLIDQGNWTMLLQVTGLSDDPAQNAVGLSSQVFIGGNYGSTPAFDTTTNWPVLSTSVKDGTTIASGATTQFTGSYVSGGTFVSGSGPSPVALDFSFGGVALPIDIHDAILTFDHTSHGAAANGTISGVLVTSELVNALQAVAGRISPSLCGPAFNGIKQQLEEAQDILQDGTNMAGPACDAISIGIGFDAVLVANPTTVQSAPPPPPDPCAD